MSEMHGAHADICGKKFRNERNHANHMRTVHEGNYKLYCSICLKGFVCSVDLEGHMNKHKGIKPHVCHLCSTTFRHKKSLTAHMKNIH